MKRLCFYLLLLLLGGQTEAKLVQYEFDIDYKPINLTGQTITALSVGGTIPAPTIEANVGDTLEVTFHNKLDVETSVHWHGILLPNDQDGVPYLTTLPIRAGASFTYRFPIKHHGTYWYHSHSGLQEQRGVYGALIFHPQNEAVRTDREYTVVFSDWTDELPEQVLANLKSEGHYYAFKKDTVQSWDQVLAHGAEAIKNRFQAAWIRMGPMDIADVGYDAFLANGKQRLHLADAQAGERIRLRLINAGASSLFDLEFAGGAMQIVAGDGVDIEPLMVQRLRMSMGETYDVVVTLPNDKAYELRATVDDRTGSAAVILGDGELVEAKDMPELNLFLISHAGHTGGHHKAHKADMAHAEHKEPKHTSQDGDAHHHHHHQPEQTDSVVPYFNRYQNMRAKTPTVLNADNPTREVRLALTGDMERYIWSFDNKTLSEADKIMIKHNENVRFVMSNETMMNHPIHLHGHFFRVLNGQGDYSPLKHTVNVPPFETVTIEFHANEEKDWFFHCHNLYHMKTGMARVVSYHESKPDPRLTAAKKAAGNQAHDSNWYRRNHASVSSNKGKLFLRFANPRNALEMHVEHDYDAEYEFEFLYERLFTRYFSAYAGFDAEQGHGETEETPMLGLRYILPLLITADARLEEKGETRLELRSELPLTKRLHFEWKWADEGEYDLELGYEINKRWLIKLSHDDLFDAGIGIKRRF